MPHAEKVLKSLSEVDSLAKPNVRTDGLLPFIIKMPQNVSSDNIKAFIDAAATIV